MTDKELREVVRKEEEERYETLKRCLFTGTEHLAGGGEMQAYELIRQLINDGLLKPSNLLRSIGYMFEDQLRKNNKNYQI